MLVDVLETSNTIVNMSCVTNFWFVYARGGFGSDESGIGQNRCPSVENKFTDNPFINRPLIGSGRSGRLSGFGGWMSGGWSGLIGPSSGLFWACK